jgi:hypothetical protein
MAALGGHLRDLTGDYRTNFWVAALVYGRGRRAHAERAAGPRQERAQSYE